MKEILTKFILDEVGKSEEGIAVVELIARAKKLGLGKSADGAYDLPSSGEMAKLIEETARTGAFVSNGFLCRLPPK